MTRWANDVDPECPWPEYPRPQFVRNEWMNLNGLWEYAIVDQHVEKVNKYDGKILVPYCVESALSGVSRRVTKKDRIWYRRKFSLSKDWSDRDILLHFGAVDWKCSVWVNGLMVGEHSGGYDPFQFDITPNVTFGSEENEIVIAVWDPTDKGRQERGKQVLKPSMVFYTAASGIWQTVWIEPVPKTRLKKVVFIPDVDASRIVIDTVILNSKLGDSLKIQIRPDKPEQNPITRIYSLDSGEAGSKKIATSIELKEVQLWSPDSPHLYDVLLSIDRKGDRLDSVESYFAMRKISLKKDSMGVPRLALNDKIVFHYGPLDQGYWPDGIYTAPTDEALRYDIELARKYGFNMIRKHIKVEPARWYYHCDNMGMLVWQDMPNGGRVAPGAIAGIAFRGKIYIPFGRLKKSVQDNYFRELRAMIETLYNYPCIAVWVPFNEGWGQFQTEKAVALIRELDSSRLINAASGWIDRDVGDIHDIHSYPGPDMPDLEPDRAVVNGEFGGLGYVAEEHVWKSKKRKWGYRKFESPEELLSRYEQLIEDLIELIEKGLSAAVYTQITDVEGEVNGLVTYDRSLNKLDPEKLKLLHERLYKVGSE